jgi:hypothetical protein
MRIVANRMSHDVGHCPSYLGKRPVSSSPSSAHIAGLASDRNRREGHASAKAQSQRAAATNHYSGPQMTATRSFGLACTLSIALAAPISANAQGTDHSAMHKADAAAPITAPSQAAFATISEIVRKLEADSSTDWSKVNLEALRQHLIDMDDVVMRSTVKQTNVGGGVSLDVTGTGKVTGAIRRMLTMHSMALSMEGAYLAKSSEIPGGVRMVVTAKDTSDAKAVARVRGLGFAGLITEGDHHAMHHMMLAKGEGMMMHQHKM